MPTLNLFTNVPVDAVVSSDILKDATKAVAKIIGKPESVKFPSTPPHINEMHRDTDTGFCFSLFSLVFVIAGFVFTVMTVNCLIILLSKITAFFGTGQPSFAEPLVGIALLFNHDTFFLGPLTGFS